MDGERFDGIIVGAGHNGLITAAYLARAGLKVAVFESRPTAGGAFSTEELNVPGFLHNTHAVYCKLHDCPAHEDLELARYGLAYVFPETKKAFVREDSCFVYYRDIEETARSIARFSPRDAQAYRNMAHKWQDWYLDIVLPELYSAPKPLDEWEAMTRSRPGGAEYADIALNYSPIEYANELFESEYCRFAVVRGASAAEYDPAAKGIPGLVFATMMNWFAGKTALIKGGTRRAAEALQRAVEAYGGKVFTGQAVEQILVEAGTAKGIVLADGRRILADRFVASSIDPVHTFLFLVGEQNLPEDVKEKVAGFKFKENSNFRVFFSLKERPNFRMSKVDPAVNDALYYTIGFEDPNDLLRMAAEADAGRIPEVSGMTGGIISTHDPSQAPPGCHTAYFGMLAPFDLAEGGAARWVDVARETAAKLVAKLRHYAPNLTEDNILAQFAYTPKDIEAYLPDLVNGDICQGKICTEQLGYNRPWAGMSRYRTCIDGLYLCGASTHPGGHAIGGPGYNAANAIAEDLGVAKWWRPFEPRKVISF